MFSYRTDSSEDGARSACPSGDNPGNRSGTGMIKHALTLIGTWVTYYDAGMYVMYTYKARIRQKKTGENLFSWESFHIFSLL
jgi:hypothetical protein